MFRFLASAILAMTLSTFFHAALASGTSSGADAAIKEAVSYSAESGGVGVVISYGRENTISADELGASFDKEIKRRGQFSKYFVTQGDHVGIGIMFRIGQWNSGWLTVSNAAAEMNSVIDKAAVQQRIVFLEARMANNRAKLIEKYGENYVEEMERRWVDNEER